MIGIGVHGRKFTDFLPTNVSNLAVWLRADKGVTFDGGGRVSQWDFENGTFRGVSNVSQGTAANQPLLIVADSNYNNQSVIDFDGNDHLDSGVFSSVITQPNTMFVVGNFGGAGNEAFLDAVAAGNREVVFQTGGATTLFAGASLSGSASDTSVHIYESTFNGVSSEIIIDGSSDATGDSGAEGLASLRIGANITPGFFLTGKEAEIIIYNANVSSSDRVKIRNYLKTRYATP